MTGSACQWSGVLMATASIPGSLSILAIVAVGFYASRGCAFLVVRLPHASFASSSRFESTSQTATTRAMSCLRMPAVHFVGDAAAADLSNLDLLAGSIRAEN